MKNNKFIIIVVLIVFSQFALSQTIDLYGKVASDLSVENIHVINKTAQKFTVTNSLGEFKVEVKLNDTLVLTSIQHKYVSFLVDETMILDKVVFIKLEEQINSLDEVVIGKILTGNILLDIGNVEEEPMTSKKAGIPSYQGKLKTQSERRLNEATTGGGIIPLNLILNAITGRTKKLKHHIKLEAQDELMYSIKARLSQDLFSEMPLENDLIMDYFYFCSEDKDFSNRCKKKSDLEILEFLREKLIQYKAIKASHKN